MSYWYPDNDEFTQQELRAISPLLRQLMADTTWMIRSLHQLQRLRERRELAASDANAAQLKTKIPQICKTMTSPSESARWIAQAVTAYRRGGDNELFRFAERERAAGRLE